MKGTSTPLKRLFAVVTGGSWGDEPDKSELVLPCVRGTDFSYERLRVDVSAAPLRGFARAEVKLRAAHRGDLIIEKSGGGETQPVGRAVLYDQEESVMPTNFAARLRPAEGVDSRFATYLLSSLYADGRTRACINQTTGIQNLDLDAFLSLRVALPDSAAQRVIADFLDRETARVDGLIVAKRRLIVLFSQRWQVIMAEGVLGRLTGPHEYRLSAIPWLKTMPTEWREGKLNLVARLGSGHTPSRNHPEWWENPSIPWITTGEVEQVRNDRIEYINETREMISELGIANSSATLHPAGTVVLCRTASAGYSAIMGRDMATSQDFATWTCGPMLRPRFLLLCLRVMRQDLLGRLAMGSTHQTIYMPEIESIKVPLPSVAEQDAIVTAVYGHLPTIDLAISDLEKQVRLLHERRQTIVTAAVTGTLELPKEAVA